MNISIFGAGYVGVVSAASLLRDGHAVTIIEPVQAKVEDLSSGRSPISEPGVAKLLEEGHAASRLQAVADPLVGVVGADMIWICVGTPSHSDGSLDISAWLVWFLRCLNRAIEDADKTLGSVLHKARLWQRINTNPVNARQRKVINRMLDNFKGHLSTSKYAKLAKCSTDTALRDMRELRERGIIVQNPGGGRSTSYRLADPDEVSE